MTVDQHDSQLRERAQHVRQRLEMKVAVHKKLRSGQGRGQVIFPPELLPAASEDNFGMSSVASQFSRQPYDAVQIAARAFFSSFTL